MTEYRLRLSLPATIPASQSRSTFYWTSEGRCSFRSTYGPRLGGLGPVPEPNVEFVRLAATVFAADRSTPRRGNGSNWSQREFAVEIPVFDPARWLAIADELAVVLGFLTGDRWTLGFYRSRSAKERIASHRRGAARVVLLSGGADSASGALVSRSELCDDEQILVSHVGATNLAPIQRAVAGAIHDLIDGPDQRHVQVGFGRRRTQPNDVPFSNEFSSRSRSLVFLAFGLAVSSIEGLPLWMPENGFASLNPPLGPDRRGSLSTRTTHPLFLQELARLLTRADVHADITNPFVHMTKGEMFSRVADLIGRGKASEMLSSTHSCGHTGHRSRPMCLPVASQCGVCFGCVVRRSAFASSGLKDRTTYLTAVTAPGLDRYLNDKSIERSMQDFISRGVRPTDVAAMSLPQTYSARDALALCSKTIDELRMLYA